MLHAAILIAAVLSYVPPGLPAIKPANAIYDGAHLLNPAETAQVAEEIAAEANAGVEAAVVTFADTDGNGPRPIAHEIQTTWNLSPKSVVYLITLKPKFVWIQPGDAFTDSISASDSERVARTEMAPRFRQAAFGAGLLAGMREVKAIVTRTNPAPVESVPVNYTPTQASTPSVQPVPEEHASGHAGLWILLGIFAIVGGYFLIQKIREYRRRRIEERYPLGENVTTVPPMNRPAEDLTPLRSTGTPYMATKPLDPYVPPTKVTNIDSNNFNLAVVDLGTPTPTPAPSIPAPSPSYSKPSTPTAAPAPNYGHSYSSGDSSSPSLSHSHDSGSGSSWGSYSSDSGGGSSWGSDSGGGFDFGGGGGDSGGGSGW